MSDTDSDSLRQALLDSLVRAVRSFADQHGGRSTRRTERRCRAIGLKAKLQCPTFSMPSLEAMEAHAVLKHMVVQ